MIKLTVIADGYKFVRNLTIDQAMRCADALSERKAALASVALTVLFEASDGVTHIIIRRDAIRGK